MPLTLPAASSLLTLFADPTRVRLVSLLAQEELSVAELTRATGLSQSRVSTHLGKLREAGLLRDRRAGASTFYRAHDAWPEEAARVWGLLSERLDDGVLQRILILDGAMGTMIQRHKLKRPTTAASSSRTGRAT
jgi:DNA-binding transcriptional ArsR family regulator